jgi:hypothetical protein
VPGHQLSRSPDIRILVDLFPHGHESGKRSRPIARATMTRHPYLFDIDSLIQARMEFIREARELPRGGERNQC